MTATPEQIVSDVVASAALDGRTIGHEWIPTLLAIAEGRVSADEVVAAEIERAREASHV